MTINGVTSAQVVRYVPDDHHQSLSLIQANWHYRKIHPFAVDVDFLLTGDVVTWQFARELLIDGLKGPAGDGDVAVRPHAHDQTLLVLDLSTPQGCARFELDHQAISRFVSRSLKLVPLGDEGRYFYPQFDRLLYSWLTGDTDTGDNADESGCQHQSDAADKKFRRLD
jgi:hypothetical protein